MLSDGLWVFVVAAPLLAIIVAKFIVYARQDREWLDQHPDA